MKNFKVGIKSLTDAKYDLYRAEENICAAMEAFIKSHRPISASLCKAAKQVMALQKELGNIRDILEEIEATATEK